MTICVTDNDSVNGDYMSANSSQNAAAKSAEKGFSENELDDIMAEFANLDAELSTSAPVAEVEEEKPEETVGAQEPVMEEVEEPVAKEVNPLDELEAAAAPVIEEEVHVEDFPAAEEFTEPAAEDDNQIISESDLEITASSEEEVSNEGQDPALVEAFSEGFDEAEMDAIMKDLEDIDAASAPTLEVEEEHYSEENVVALNHAEEKHVAPEATVAHAPATDAGAVSFSAAGNMNFNVNLTIAGSQATLSVQDGCFKLTMNGVDISITEEGCKAFIEGGVNFNIPLPSDKKDVA